MDGLLSVLLVFCSISLLVKSKDSKEIMFWTVITIANIITVVRALTIASV